MKSSIILIRHGESLANLNPSHYQYPDVANILSLKGVKQCLGLMDEIHTHLEPDHFGTHTKVIASEFQRAKITADIVMSKVNLKLPITYDYRLNEVYHIENHKPEETPEEVKHRVHSLVTHNPFNLVLFTHGLLMRMIDPSKKSVKNCAIRKYDRQEFLKLLEV
jgi:phosphohistidine phosphatase SixA